MKKFLFAAAMLLASASHAQDITVQESHLLADETTWQQSRTPGKVLIISNNDSVAARIISYGKACGCIQYSYKKKRKRGQEYPVYTIHAPKAIIKPLENIL